MLYFVLLLLQLLLLRRCVQCSLLYFVLLLLHLLLLCRSVQCNLLYFMLLLLQLLCSLLELLLACFLLVLQLLLACCVLLLKLHCCYKQLLLLRPQLLLLLLQRRGRQQQRSLGERLRGLGEQLLEEAVVLAVEDNGPSSGGPAGAGGASAVVGTRPSSSELTEAAFGGVTGTMSPICAGSAGSGVSRGRCSGGGTASAGPLDVPCEAPEPARLKGDCASFGISARCGCRSRRL